MSWKLSARVFVLFSGLCSACFAAPPMNQGVIHFSGSVVEPACSFSSAADTLRLDACSSKSHPAKVAVKPLPQSLEAGSATDAQMQAKLISDTSRGHLHDQRYVLVTATGKPVKTGHYLVTLTEL
ncbi:type 1 fimbrial protein [Pseudomonas sp. CNPSo 3701]|uniref:type 1 fimbrial protein n=1 Tax=Pseudomonas sp. CNPSo 3701 TaxID=3027943 RepID=UPI002363E9F3|nr:type 1 fimbrial protein [Pseudomonas sp. CNPSo 3701]MDD1509313.1 type 1 fimbrial protein [Pseudomonas sp. CNPSo 3701]